MASGPANEAPYRLIEDVDFGGATASMLAQYVTAAEPQRAAMERLYQAFAKVFVAIGADPSYGSRLTGVIADSGLSHVAAAGSQGHDRISDTLLDCRSFLVRSGVERPMKASKLTEN